ncbi:hypothetical protein ABW21_db0204499 [Orbilia brochopaga]|nr:hypothetical protein ABW21_db0204499 [Drechslerella brochopaga]
MPPTTGIGRCDGGGLIITRRQPSPPRTRGLDCLLLLAHFFFCCAYRFFDRIVFFRSDSMFARSPSRLPFRGCCIAGRSSSWFCDCNSIRIRLRIFRRAAARL